VLFTPGGTHPMDHISTTAIGHSLDWFARTLEGGTPKAPDDQIWYWKEIGTFIALIGFVVFILGAFDTVLALPYFSGLVATPIDTAVRNTRWWITLAVGMLLPAITLLPFFELGSRIAPATWFWPQGFTNEIVTWAVLNGLLIAALSLLPGRSMPRFNVQVGRSVTAALLTVGLAYVVTAAVDFFFKVDFRIWFIAFRPITLAHFKAFLAYLLPFTLFFVVALRSLHGSLALQSTKLSTQYLTNIAALAGGFVLFLFVQYGSLFATHSLLSLFGNDALRVIVSINFVPLMCIVAIVSTFAYRRTASYLPGAFMSALLVTWYVVANQATHVAT
jgi:hypothetical protein